MVARIKGSSLGDNNQFEFDVGKLYDGISFGQSPASASQLCSKASIPPFDLQFTNRNDVMVPIVCSQRWLLAISAYCFLNGCVLASTFGQDVAPPQLLDFAADVQPILETRCLKCHGPDEAKNDFRVDDPESMSAYVEAGDLESSSLWADYLLTDDPDMLMPPATDEAAGGLPGRELAILKLWIEEGATLAWVHSTVDATLATPTADKLLETRISDRSVLSRGWSFIGLFHPASVHFPIALLMISGVFAVLSFFGKATFEPVAFHCLWIGALSAIAASILGWSYATHKGYGSGFSFDLQGSSIDRHRWLGIAVAVVATLLIPVARGACRSGSINKKLLWAFGAILVAFGVSIVGYQGGELTYGEDHYGKEFRRLFPAAAAPEVATPSEAAPNEATPEEATPSEAIPEEATPDLAQPEERASNTEITEDDVKSTSDIPSANPK